jgi:3-dehydroquinate dehydratase/shikimate dehydrogenase
VHACNMYPVATSTLELAPADAYRVLSVLRRCPVPCIALAMGERGQVTRLLAPKYGGFLTFGALSPERASGGTGWEAGAGASVRGVQRTLGGLAW